MAIDLVERGSPHAEARTLLYLDAYSGAVLSLRPYARVSTGLTVALVAATLSGCGGPKGDQLRTVRSYEFATCDSAPTTDPTERAALDAFKGEIEISNFIRAKNTLTVAVKLRNGQWDVEPLAISVYEKPELERLRPVPTRAQIDAKEAVEPMHLRADDNTPR